MPTGTAAANPAPVVFRLTRTIPYATMLTFAVTRSNARTTTIVAWKG